MLMFRCQALGGVAFIASISLLAAAQGAEKSAEVTPERIVKAWQDRQHRVRSFRVRWDRRMTVAKGSYLSGDKASRKNPRGLTVPAKTTTYDTSYALTMDGGKMRYTRNQLWLSANSDLIHQEGTMVSTAKGHKMLLQPGSMPFPRGFIAPQSVDKTDVDDPALLPLMIAFRPFHPAIDLFKDFAKRFTVVPGRTMIAGRSCIQFKEKTALLSQPFTTVWLDGEHDFAVIREARIRGNGQLMSQVTFTDFREAESVWIPRQWKTVGMRGDSVETSAAATVRDFELNIPIDEKEFELAFPPGTWVIDGRKPGARYILKENGEKRPILESELRGQATYEQLRDTKPGQALNKPSVNRHWLLIPLAVATAVAVALLIARRIWKLRAVRPHSSAQQS